MENKRVIIANGNTDISIIIHYFQKRKVKYEITAGFKYYPQSGGRLSYD